MSLGVKKDAVYGSSVVQFLFAKFLVLAQVLFREKALRNFGYNISFIV